MEYNRMCELCGKGYVTSTMQYWKYCPDCKKNRLKDIMRKRHQENKIKRLTIGDIKRFNAKAGQHWFSPDTMKFFKSKVPNDYEGLYGNKYFITSERSPWDKRKYSIREWRGKTKNIETVGEFNSFNSKAQAMRVLKKLMDGKI